MPIGNYSFTIYSNDGSTALVVRAQDPIPQLEVGDDSVISGGVAVYTYTGTKTFKGLATTSNATDAVYVSGDTIELTYDGIDYFYIVEADPAPTDAVTVEYNGSVIASLKAGQSATLPCKDTLMHTDVVVTVPEGMGAGEVVEEWDGSYTVSGGEVTVLGDITITAVGKAHNYSVHDGSGAFVSEGTIASGSSVHLTNIESGWFVSLTNGNVVLFSNAVNCSYDYSGNITNIGVGASITANYSDIA